MGLNKVLTLVVLVLGSSVVLISESLYREPLFEWSLSIQESIHHAPTTAKLVNLYSYLGTIRTYIPIYIALFLTLDLPRSGAFLTLLGFGTWLTNFLKGIYANPRPVWIDPKLEVLHCDGGFGNPSGHAISSVSILLSLWHLLCSTQAVRTRGWLRWSLLLGFLCVMASLLWSRIYLNVHSFNQVLFGGLLGFLVFWTVHMVLQLDKLSVRDFTMIFFDRVKTTVALVIMAACFLMSVLSFIANENDKALEQDIRALCVNIKDYRIMQNDSFYQSMAIFSVVGGFLGLKLALNFLPEGDKTSEEELRSLSNPRTWRDALYVALALLATGLVAGIPAVAVSPDSSLLVLFLFRSAFPYFSSLFLINAAIPIILHISNSHRPGAPYRVVSKEMNPRESSRF